MCVGKKEYWEDKYNEVAQRICSRVEETIFRRFHVSQIGSPIHWWSTRFAVHDDSRRHTAIPDFSYFSLHIELYTQRVGLVCIV